MAGTDATDLQALCQSVLASSAEALDQLPALDPAFEGAPARQFVSPGQPALDCCDPSGQLTVHAGAVTDAPVTPGGLYAGKRQPGNINHVAIVITIARCIPVAQDTGEPPDVDDLNAASAQTNADAWVLWNHLWNLWREGLLFTDANGQVQNCGEVFWDGMRPLAPSSCGGWTLLLRTRLDGYQEASSS